MLGIVASSKPSAEDSRSALSSKIGGRPVYHDAKAAARDLLDPLICGVCQEAAHMAMVAQVYAPVDVNRSLYVYVCMKNRCSISSDGWVVMRNQDNRARVASVAAAATSSSIASSVSAQPLEESSSWGENNWSAAASVSASSSSWNFSEVETTVTENTGSWLDAAGAMDSSQLESLLQARDTSLKQKPAKNSKTTQTLPKQVEKDLPSESLNCCLLQWPCWAIHEQEDNTEYPTYDDLCKPTRASKHKGKNKVDEDDDEDDDDDDDDDQNLPMGAATIASDEKIAVMLASYYADEEDKDLVVKINEGILLSERERSNDAHITSSVATASSARSTVAMNGDRVAAVTDGEGGEEVHNAAPIPLKVLSRSDMRNKIEQLFQTVVSYNPKQVMHIVFSKPARGYVPISMFLAGTTICLRWLAVVVLRPASAAAGSAGLYSAM
jgi:hypothetical protein